MRAPSGLAWPAEGILCGALIACSAGNSPPPPADRGEQLYAATCIACHGSDGRGLAEVYPSLAGSPVVVGDEKSLALWVIKGERPASMPAGRYPSAMPRFGWLKNADAAALLTYIRSHFGNRAAAVDAAAVGAALRGGAGP